MIFFFVDKHVHAFGKRHVMRDTGHQLDGIFAHDLADRRCVAVASRATDNLETTMHQRIDGQTVQILLVEAQNGNARLSLGRQNAVTQRRACTGRLYEEGRALATSQLLDARYRVLATVVDDIVRADIITARQLLVGTPD